MLASQLVNGWQFSGAEIASAGEPIFLGVSGTIYSGNTVSSSYADESGIFGGAMSSSSGGATSGRPPQIGRNSIPAPGFNDLDMRVTRNFKIHENISLQFNAEAFNLLNHKIITGVNGTYTTFLTPGASATGSGEVHMCLRLLRQPAPAILDALCPIQVLGFRPSARLRAQAAARCTARGTCRSPASCSSNPSHAINQKAAASAAAFVLSHLF